PLPPLSGKPVSSGQPPHPPSVRPPAPPSSVTGPTSTQYRVALSASPVKPRVGQEVDLLVRVTTTAGGPIPGEAAEPHFHILGPGGLSVQLPAMSEGPGVFRGRFAFLEAGTYQVIFNAKLDGNPVRALRVVLAGDAAGAPVPSPPAPTPSETVPPAP